MKLPTFRQIRGTAGEQAAAKLLRKGGYRILARNYKPFRYEIDIIAEEKKTGMLVFVEVKARRLLPGSATRETRPAAAVDPEKQRHIVTAAKCYLASIGNTRKCRFDVIEIYLDPASAEDKILAANHMISAFHA